MARGPLPHTQLISIFGVRRSDPRIIESRAVPRRVLVSRVAYGDSRSLTGQPAAHLTCAAAGLPVAVTTFASRGSRRRDAARRLALIACLGCMNRTYLPIVDSWR